MVCYFYPAAINHSATIAVWMYAKSLQVFFGAIVFDCKTAIITHKTSSPISLRDYQSFQLLSPEEDKIAFKSQQQNITSQITEKSWVTSISLPQLHIEHRYSRQGACSSPWFTHHKYWWCSHCNQGHHTTNTAVHFNFPSLLLSEIIGGKKISLLLRSHTKLTFYQQGSANGKHFYFSEAFRERVCSDHPYGKYAKRFNLCPLL